MKTILFFSRRIIVPAMIVTVGLFPAFRATAAFTYEVSPAKGASAVSPTSPVIFRFSEAVDPSSSVIMFLSGSTPLMNMTQSWSADTKAVTNSPNPAFPSPATIQWVIDAVSLESFDEIQDFGAFITSGGTGGCTNYVGSYTVAKASFSKQNSTAGPTFDPTTPFAFVACSSAACTNLTATNLWLTFPPSPMGPAMLNVGATGPGHFNLTQPYSSAFNLDTMCPAGNYTFTLQGPTFELQFPLSYPGFAMPVAPFVTNYAAAQAVDPAHDFILGWAPFSERASAGAICVEIYGGVFKTPSVGEPGALTGAATSVRIPAGTLTANTTYQGAITFYDYVLQTNLNSITLAYYSAVTEFSLAASDGTPPLRIENLSTTLPFSFELSTVPGQALTVEWSSSVNPLQWQTLTTTNATGSRVKIVDSAATGAGCRFYRARKGL